jgi:hypothetical protein
MEDDSRIKTPIEKIEAELKEWGLDVDKFASRARQAAGNPTIDELKKAGADGAKEVEKGLEAAWGELRKAFDAAASKFKQGS